MVAASAVSTSIAMAIGLFMKEVLTCDVTYISFFFDCVTERRPLDRLEAATDYAGTPKAQDRSWGVGFRNGIRLGGLVSFC